MSSALIEIIPPEWDHPAYRSKVVKYLIKHPATDRYLLKYAFLDWCAAMKTKATAREIEQILIGREE